MAKGKTMPRINEVAQGLANGKAVPRITEVAQGLASGKALPRITERGETSDGMAIRVTRATANGWMERREGGGGAMAVA
jgi:hypothetical protein